MSFFKGKVEFTIFRGFCIQYQFIHFLSRPNFSEMFLFLNITQLSTCNKNSCLKITLNNLFGKELNGFISRTLLATFFSPGDRNNNDKVIAIKYCLASFFCCCLFQQQ